MKLRERLALKSKAGKRYYRFDLPLPKKLIEELGWTKDTALACRVEGHNLVVSRAGRGQGK